MMERDRLLEVPSKQRMERQETIAKEHNEEHNNALERAVTLKVPHAFSPSYGTFDKHETGSELEVLLDEHGDRISDITEVGEPSTDGQTAKRKTDWDELINRLFQKDASGKIVLKKEMDSV
eukprot:Gb_23707 [translate_table: standard]